jgi:hypothetical protein
MCPDGKIIGRVVNFEKHQVVNRPSPSKFSGLTIEWEPDDEPYIFLTDNSVNDHDGKGTGNREQGREQGKGGQRPSVAAPTLALEPDDDEPAFLDRTPVGEVVKAWNGMAEEVEERLGVKFPRVQKITADRRRLTLARLKDCGGIEGFKAAVGKVAASARLRGERNGNGHEAWVCSFDFLVNERNFVKIMEGNYDDRQRGLSAGEYTDTGARAGSESIA